MKINVAGVEKEVAEGLTIAELIVAEKVENPDYVTVVLNDEFVEKDNFETTALSAGDKVEFLYFMGGGSRHAKHPSGKSPISYLNTGFFSAASDRRNDSNGIY